MKSSLYQSLLSRLKNKHSKLSNRFQKSVKDGEFQKQRFRKRKESIERLKGLERRIATISKQSGLKVALSHKHWAVALAMGVVASTNAQETEKQKFKERYKQVAKTSKAPLAASFSDPVILGNAYLTNILTGDLDGDGDLDGVYTSSVDNPIVLINQGNFSFTQSELPVNSSGIISRVLLGDFDGDGNLDLFVLEGTYGTPPNAQVWLNDGSAGFTLDASAVFPTVDQEDDVILIADIDGDSDADIVGVTENGLENEYVTIFPNNSLDFSDTTALKGGYSGDPESRLVALMDVDGDTDQDIVFTAQVSMIGNTLQVFGNDGVGGFTNEGGYLSFTNSINNNSPGRSFNIDNDADLDLVAFIDYATGVHFRHFYNDGTLLSDGTSNFTEGDVTEVTSSSSEYPENIFPATINGDSFEDMIAATEDSTFVFTGDGEGMFILASSFPGASIPANLDADGDADFFLFDGNLKTVETLNENSFSINADLVTVSSTYDVDLIDLDDDGDLDFVEAGGLVSRTWFNDGAGNFTVAQEMPGNAYQFEFGDLDGDGDQDMLKVYEDDPVDGTPGGIELWTNDGFGLLTVVDTIGQGVFGEEDVVFIGNFDSDSDLDVAIFRQDGEYGTKYLETLSNDGNFEFSSISSYIFVSPVAAVDFGDIDGDNDIDALVAYRSYEYGVRPFFNNGAGNLEEGTSVPIPFGNGNSLSDIDIADFDGDGDLDFFLTRYNDHAVFFNDDLAPGTFPVSTSIGFTGYTYKGFVNDTDNDGDIDIVFGGYASNPVIWENDGLGSFSVDTEILALADEYTNLVFGDIDGDGDDDIAFGGYYTGTKIFFNLAVSGTPPTPLENDSTALVNFYQDMGGENWTDNTNWLIADQNLEDWFGVDLNNEGDRVESVVLPNNGLEGTLSDEINNLDALVTLDVSNNSLDALGTNFSGLTNATSIVLDGNQLDFNDLESVANVDGISYGDQQTEGVVTIDQQGPIEIPAGSNQLLSVTSQGGANTYQWLFNDGDINGATEPSYNIASIGRDNQGNYEIIATNTDVPGLSFTDEIDVFATAVITIDAIDADTETSITENINAYLFELDEVEAADTVEFDQNPALNATSPVTLPPIILGDFIVAVESVVPLSDGDGIVNEDAVYIPTFLGDQFESALADTLFLEDDITLTITMEEIPPERDETTGSGVVSGTIEEDFEDDAGRIDARRRAARRKCGLKKRRTGGGRPGQDDSEFDLIAYGETNDNGEFEYGFLPVGTYRFFVEYPGIPLDDSAFVQFDIGPAGVTDDSFVLAVFASEDGIFIELVLGITSDFFHDFSIYPNPTTDLLTIEYGELRSSKVEMEIVNMEGKTLMSRSIKNTQDKIQLDTSILPAGQYLIKFSDGNEKNNLIYRLIKK